MSTGTRGQRPVALVTGAASGVGAGIVRALAAGGHRIVAVDLDAERAADVAATVGDAFAFPADVRDRAALDSAAQAVVERFGRLDVVCANAGVVPRERPVETLDEKTARRLVEVNLLGAHFTVQAAIPRMGPKGTIVLTSSTSGLIAHPGNALYAATKQALIGLMRSLAIELAPRHIRVNAVCPGGTDTPLVRALYTATELAASARANPLGRLAEPDDVGAAVAFLVGASHVNGVALPVDGGELVQPPSDFEPGV